MLRYSFSTMLLYMTLISAALNDLLRIPDTQISLFRIMMVFSVIYCLNVNSKCRKYMIVLLVLLLINIVQAINYSEMNNYGLGFSLDVFLFNAFFYCCIVAVIMVISTLANQDNNFEVNGLKIIKNISYFYVLILFVVLLDSNVYSQLTSHKILTNMNDISASVAAVYPIFLYEALKEKDVRSIAFCIISFFVVCFLGRKLATAGMVVEIIAMFLYIGSFKLTIKACWGILLFSFIGTIIYLLDFGFFTKISNILDIVMMSADYIWDGHVFTKVDDSMSFRVSTFIYGAQEIVNSNFMGIGMGNAAYLLRDIMPMGDYMMKGDGAVSTHNFIIQLLLEFGFVAIVFFVMWLRYVLRLIKIKIKGKLTCAFITMSTGVWLWGLAPSGFYTTYYIHIIFLYIIFALKGNGLYKRNVQ